MACVAQTEILDQLTKANETERFGMAVNINGVLRQAHGFYYRCLFRTWKNTKLKTIGVTTHLHFGFRGRNIPLAVRAVGTVLARRTPERYAITIITILPFNHIIGDIHFDVGCVGHLLDGQTLSLGAVFRHAGIYVVVDNSLQLFIFGGGERVIDWAVYGVFVHIRIRLVGAN